MTGTDPLPPAQTPSADADASLHSHRQLWDAIAWVVAGSATPSQREQVLAHLPHCAHCEAEMALQQQIHQSMQDEPLPAGDEAQLQAGLAQLWAREDAAGPTGPLPAAPQTAANDSPGLGRLTRWLSAAVAVQAVALCMMGLQLWGLEPHGRAEGNADFQTLSDHQPGTISSGSVASKPGSLPRWRVVLDARTDLGQLQALLNRHQLRLVGSDELNRSLLLVASQPLSASAQAQVLSALRAEPGMLMAEALDPPAH